MTRRSVRAPADRATGSRTRRPRDGVLRVDDIDLNLFRVFDVVYRERHVGRAAASLSVTQSAVSHALARLRRQLDDPLFVREGRALVPTAVASQLAPGIEAALAGLRRTLGRRDDFDPARDLRRVVVALPSEVEPIALSALYARLHAAAPETTLTLVRLERARLRADLTAGHFDLAIDVAHGTDAAIAQAPLVKDALGVVASKKRSSLTRATYFAAEHIAVSSRRAGPTLEDAQLGSRARERRVVVRCQRYEAACLLAADSDLLLTMPRRQAMLRARRMPIRVFDLPLKAAPVALHMYWWRDAGESVGHRWLRDRVREALASG